MLGYSAWPPTCGYPRSLPTCPCPHSALLTSAACPVPTAHQATPAACQAAGDGRASDEVRAHTACICVPHCTHSHAWMAAYVAVRKLGHAFRRPDWHSRVHPAPAPCVANHWCCVSRLSPRTYRQQKALATERRAQANQLVRDVERLKAKLVGIGVTQQEIDAALAKRRGRRGSVSSYRGSQ